MLRGEETVQGKILSDLDLLVVSKFSNPLLSRRLKAIEGFYNAKLSFHVNIGCMALRVFKKNKSLLLYETKKEGHVIYGEPTVLDCISMNSPADIPKWEGVRLLFNRFFELLKAKVFDEDISYPMVKAYLAIGEAYLVFDGRYTTTYKGRLEEIQRKSMYPVSKLLEKFVLCSKYKLNLVSSLNNLSYDETMSDLVEAISYFLKFYSATNHASLEQVELTLNTLSKTLYTPTHAAVFFTKKILAGQFDGHVIFREPCIDVWIKGIQLVNECPMDGVHAAQIISDWETAEQPYVTDSF